jgi:hypothetical protein
LHIDAEHLSVSGVAVPTSVRRAEVQDIQWDEDRLVTTLTLRDGTTLDFDATWGDLGATELHDRLAKWASPPNER